MINFTYNGLNLQASGITASDTDIYSSASKTIQAEKLAEADGSVTVKETYESKTFKLEGSLSASTIQLFETLLDTFKAAMNTSKQNFDLDYAGGTRRYVATPKNVIISRPQGMNRAGFSIDFFCESPVGSDTTPTTLLSGYSITSSTAIAPITIGGTYKAEPDIIVTLSSVTGGTTGKTMTIANDTNLQGVSITRDWANGDVIEIDTMNRSLYINNISTNSSGLFPAWDVGNGGLSYIDNFTTRSVLISASYTKRYL